MGALTHGNIRITLPLRAIQADRAEAMARLALTLPRAIERVRTELGAGGL
jgi:cysteine desulfurase